MPPALPASIALITLLFSPPSDHSTREFDAQGLDPEAVELGLRARVGDDLEGWAIQVESRGGPRYSLSLRGPEEDRTDERDIELGGQTDADRSRELASMLAMIIEADPDLDPPAPTRGFVALEGHLGLGPPRAFDPDLGLGLGAGAWLLRDHLQPRIRVAWSHAWSGDLRVNQLGVGLGLAAGAPIGRHHDGVRRGQLWIGALVMPAFAWTHVEQVRVGTVWSGGGELGALLQYRRPHLVLGVRTGIETTFPALRALGSPKVIRFGHLRWLLAIEVGLSFSRPTLELRRSSRSAGRASDYTRSREREAKTRDGAPPAPRPR